MNQKTFVIEVCEGCANHAWNTRHDPNQYKNYAMNTSRAIKEKVPDCDIVFNMVPKVYAMSDIYCQLLRNDDPEEVYYQMMPRIGSFEISINGVLLFSKSLSGLWPNYGAIAMKAAQVCQAIDQNQDITVFQTTGKEKKMTKKGKMGATGQNFKPAQ